MVYAAQYLAETAQIVEKLDPNAIEKLARMIVEMRAQGGRLFILGVGGGAGHASHAVCDFRKIAGIECYAPSDNVSELTARVNDEVWDTTYAGGFQISRLCGNDLILIFSV